MVFRARWTEWVIPLAVGGFLAGSLTLAPKSMASQEEGLHAHDHAELHSEVSEAREVEIVMREGAYHVAQGVQLESNSILLVAGEEVRLSIRNEDTMAHEVISQLFIRTDIHIEGKGIGVFRNQAGGFRLRPGDSMTAQFTVPFFEFESFYDLIWCGRHGSQFGKGQEFLVVRTQSQPHRP